MLIGHLPAGYFATRYLTKRLKIRNLTPWFLVGLIAAVMPDFDIIYSIFYDNGGSHRYYITYKPLIYLILLVICLIIYYCHRKSWLKYGMIIVFVNLLVHLLLDTPFVGVMWLWPFYNHLIGIYNVDLTHGILVANYFRSWYWYLEIALWILAIIDISRSYKKGELG